MSSILIINPNSSVSISENLKSILSPPSGFSFTFYTAPEEAPKQIDSYTTGALSATVCYKDIISRELLDQYDGFVVGCFSDHALVHMLREATRKPVIGIFQASVLHSLALGSPFAIITTATVWKKLLDDAVLSMIGTTGHMYKGTYTTGLGVLEIHELDHEQVVQRLVNCANQAVSNGATALILGCAGLTGLDEAVQKAVGDKIVIIDSVLAATEIVTGLVRANYTKTAK